MGSSPFIILPIDEAYITAITSDITTGINVWNILFIRNILVASSVNSHRRALPTIIGNNAANESDPSARYPLRYYIRKAIIKAASAIKGFITIAAPI